MDQKMCFGIICITYAVRTENFNIFHYFSQKNMQNSLFQQCKSLIGNNSGSIKDRDVKFAYSRCFSEIADRMV